MVGLTMSVSFLLLLLSPSRRLLTVSAARKICKVAIWLRGGGNGVIRLNRGQMAAVLLFNG